MPEVSAENQTLSPEPWSLQSASHQSAFCLFFCCLNLSVFEYCYRHELARYALDPGSVQSFYKNSQDISFTDSITLGSYLNLVDLINFSSYVINNRVIIYIYVIYICVSTMFYVYII